MMMMMMLIMMVMIISQMELWRRGGRVDFRQKGRTPAEAQGSVDDNEYDNMMNMMMMMMMMMATCPVGCTSSPGDCRPAWSNASEPGPLQDHHRNHDGYKYPNLHISKSKYQYKSIKDQNPCFQISLVTDRPGKEGRRLWPDSHHVVARHQLTLVKSSSSPSLESPS